MIVILLSVVFSGVTVIFVSFSSYPSKVAFKLYSPAMMSVKLYLPSVSDCVVNVSCPLSVKVTFANGFVPSVTVPLLLLYPVLSAGHRDMKYHSLI